MAKRGSGLTKLKYKPSADLAEIVGSKPISRPEVTKKIWAYIKKYKLQNKINKREINPNSKLSAVTGSGSFDMMKLAGKLSPHLVKI